MPDRGSDIYYISGPKHNRIGDGGAVDITSITENSTPNLDTSWIGNNGWDCSDWVAWHKALVAAYGLDKANAIWYQQWASQSSWASPYNWCKYDNNFVNYFKGTGLDIGSIVSNLTVPVVQSAETIVSTVSQGATTAAANLVTTADNATGLAQFLSSLVKPVALVALIGAGYWAYKEFIKE